MKLDFNKILQFLLPKFYNRLTWVIVIAGISLMANSLLWEILNAILKINFQITIINENDPIFGLICILLALIYNAFINSLEYKKETHKLVDRIKDEEESKDHDRLTFQTYDEILPEEKFENFIGRLWGSHETHSDYLVSLDRYVDHARKSSNSFVINELEELKEKFTKDLHELGMFVGLNFFTTRFNVEISQMHPDGNWDRSNFVTPESDAHYQECTVKLNKLIHDAQESYRTYRRRVKEILKK